MSVLSQVFLGVLWAQLLPVAHADLPVHCLRHQVLGEWEFTLGPLGPKRTACGHSKPDSPDNQPPRDLVTNAGATSKKVITLSDPNSAVSQEGGMGTFTMIYDEAWEVAIDGLNFMAFSKFNFVNDPQQGRTNVSHCDQTQVGWYHNQDRTQWGCYSAKITGAKDADDDANQTAPVSTPVTQDASPEASPPAALNVMSSSLWDALDSTTVPQPPAQLEKTQREEVDVDSTSLPDAYKPWIPQSAGFEKPITSSWQTEVAAGLNLLQLGWKAVVYHHYTGKTPKEMNQMAGIRRNIPKVVAKKEPPSPSSFLAVQSKLRRFKANEPEGFSWANKDGQNYLGPVVTQGDCGSCYTISTVNMLSARNRIRSGVGAEPFSINFPLYCSEYNQGCDGGYGFLQSKWSEDIGLLPEHCAPFSGPSMCSVSPGCALGETRHRAVNHHYVGGYYGASEEDPIKMELVSGGPLVMSFEPKEDFMYYKSGVYKSYPDKIHQEWQQVDHAVLLVGYGEDAGSKYWTMQNSWGTEWGEKGFFRMARGQDESGCESIVVSADVVEERTNPVLDDFLAGVAAP